MSITDILNSYPHQYSRFVSLLTSSIYNLTAILHLNLYWYILLISPLKCSIYILNLYSLCCYQLYPQFISSLLFSIYVLTAILNLYSLTDILEIYQCRYLQSIVNHPRIIGCDRYAATERNFQRVTERPSLASPHSPLSPHTHLSLSGRRFAIPSALYRPSLIGPHCNRLIITLTVTTTSTSYSSEQVCAQRVRCARGGGSRLRKRVCVGSVTSGPLTGRVVLPATPMAALPRLARVHHERAKSLLPPWLGGTCQVPCYSWTFLRSFGRIRWVDGSNSASDLAKKVHSSASCTVMKYHLNYRIAMAYALWLEVFYWSFVSLWVPWGVVCELVAKLFNIYC